MLHRTHHVRPRSALRHRLAITAISTLRERGRMRCSCHQQHPFSQLEIVMDNGHRRSKKRPLQGKGVLATLLSIPLLSGVVSAHAPVYFGSPSRDSPLVPPQIPLVGSPSSPETHEFVRILFISSRVSLANYISLYLVTSSHLPPRNA